MLFRFHIEHAEGTFDVSTLPVDVISWERKNKSKMAQLTNSLGMDDLAFIGYSCLKRLGDTEQPYEKWLDGLQVIEPQAEQPGPTPGEQ